MASITRHRTLVNPGTRHRKRKRNMSLKQLLHFGTKRQRAGAKARITNARQRRSNTSLRKSKKRGAFPGSYSRGAMTLKGYSKPKRKFKKRKNVGTILSILPNGRKSRVRRRKRRTTNRTTIKVYNKRKRRINKGMARTRKRSKRTTNKASHRTYRRRRRAISNPVRRRRRRTRNVRYVKRMSRGVYKYSNPRRRRRSRVANRRSYHRRRNPGILSGGAGKIVGIIGGAAVTAILSKFIPSSLSSGFMGYVSKGIVAVLQGRLVGKVSGSRALGQDFMYGGLAYVALGVLSDMFGLNLPGFGMRGMGLITPSNFFVPQVNAPGSMGSFVRPAMVPAPYVAPAGGMGNVRRGGRVR